MQDYVQYIASVITELEQLINVQLLNKLYSTVRLKGNK